MYFMSASIVCGTRILRVISRETPVPRIAVKPLPVPPILSPVEPRSNPCAPTEFERQCFELRPGSWLQSEKSRQVARGFPQKARQSPIVSHHEHARCWPSLLVATDSRPDTVPSTEAV